MAADMPPGSSTSRAPAAAASSRTSVAAVGSTTTTSAGSEVWLRIDWRVFVNSSGRRPRVGITISTRGLASVTTGRGYRSPLLRVTDCCGAQAGTGGRAQGSDVAMASPSVAPELTTPEPSGPEWQLAVLCGRVAARTPGIPAGATWAAAGFLFGVAVAHAFHL